MGVNPDSLETHGCHGDTAPRRFRNFARPELVSWAEPGPSKKQDVDSGWLGLHGTSDDPVSLFILKKKKKRTKAFDVIMPLLVPLLKK